MIRHPLLAAVLAVAAFLVACALTYVTGPLADTGAGLLPMIAAVSIATAVAGAGWGLLAFGLGAAFTLLLLMPPHAAPLPSNPTLQLIVALYTIAALLVLVTVAALRARLARLAGECALLEETLERLGDGVLTTDAAGRVARMNRSAERLTGWRAADARGRPLAQILHLATPGAAPAEERLTAGEASTDRPSTLIASDGSEHAVVPLVTPVPAPNGDDGRVILLRDAGAWQRMQEDLRGLIAELWAANRQKDEAIAALTAGGAAQADEARVVAPERSGAPEPPGERRRAPQPVPSEPDTQPDAAVVAASPERRVLMLCDDSESAFALSMLLGMAGYEVKTVASAPEALRHAACFAPRVALIDTTMDDTDGLAAAKALRSVCAELDLVALTNPGKAHDARELAAAGYVIAVPKTEPLRLKRWLATRRAA